MNQSFMHGTMDNWNQRQLTGNKSPKKRRYAAVPVYDKRMKAWIVHVVDMWYMAPVKAFPRMADAIRFRDNAERSWRMAR